MVAGVKFIKEHVPGIVAVYDLYLKIIEAKVKLVKKLEQIRQIGTFVETEKVLSYRRRRICCCRQNGQRPKTCR